MEEKKKRIIEYDAECKACDGTGIYVGMAERDGAGVVCHRCKGTGCCAVRIEYTPFTERWFTNKVKRVYRVNPGIVIGEGGQYKLEDFGGIPYAGWVNGLSWPEGSEDRAHTCPAWWYQSADYEKKPDWDECAGCGAFSRCRHFANKTRCWDRWDKEQSLLEVEEESDGM